MINMCIHYFLFIHLPDHGDERVSETCNVNGIQIPESLPRRRKWNVSRNGLDQEADLRGRGGIDLESTSCHHQGQVYYIHS